MKITEYKRKKMTPFHNPSGEKKIVIDEKNSISKIIITDDEAGNKNFSLSVDVKGDNAKVEVIGRMEAKNSDEKKWNISLILHGKNQTGILDLKGISNDNSSVEFDGGGIAKSSSEAGNIQVSEKIFLFSEKAKAKAIPVLRVETENISSASHSASISPFSKELFFFLESRGIPKEEGKILLKQGILEI